MLHENKCIILYNLDFFYQVTRTPYTLRAEGTDDWGNSFPKGARVVGGYYYKSKESTFKIVKRRKALVYSVAVCYILDAKDKKRKYKRRWEPTPRHSEQFEHFRCLMITIILRQNKTEIWFINDKYLRVVRNRIQSTLKLIPFYLTTLITTQVCN